jgi:23S rRNA pseudouridine1911/1915/1917 synthase
VLWRDEHLLAVAKPRGLPTMPAGGFLTHTLLHIVQARFPGAAAMHRLGRGTSGLVLFARTAEAAPWRRQEPGARAPWSSSTARS